jgi:ubiquitin C-terminal hydrolase
VPAESDKQLIDFLGKDALERFVFISLEWSDSSFEDGENEKKTEPKIVEHRFLAFDVHPSLTEAEKKHTTMNGVKGLTLDQCFEHFTQPERLDEQNKWYCSKCKEHVRAMKTMELWRLPNVLVVHLKRFEFKNVLRRDKLDTFVDFPLEGLDMSIHSSLPSEVSAEYDLFGVVNHYGRLGFGHYTAFARDWDEVGMSNEWFLFDDSNVRSVGDGKGRDGMSEGVVSPSAYVLFYRRRIFS